MKKFASMLCVALFAMTLVVGCGKKDAADTTKDVADKAADTADKVIDKAADVADKAAE
ncbi:MAG: hypothetical protein HN909_06995 [Phycisphaerales bacterium]|jgi:hypothetical protein|nr:hypothetical protein [Phycisphaerales bacterium]MBT7171498.1 hypothetical protein [Phycisphaerales bacterium]